jgi:nucleotide-binding universal stress UspA family protein
MGIVVAAIDLSEDSKVIIDRTIDVLKKDQTLVLVYVSELIYFDLGYDSYMRFEDMNVRNKNIIEQMDNYVKYSLSKVSNVFSELVVSSSVSTGIAIDVCDSYDVDLIVCGKRNKLKRDIFHHSKSVNIVKSSKSDVLVINL